MSARICPYCKGLISSAAEDQIICEGCETPHHRDCFEENRGCTVFGCRCAPADEPKVTVTAPELSQAEQTVPTTPGPQAWVPNRYSPLGLSGRFTPPNPMPSIEREEPQHYKSKTKFVLLGVLLGAVGAHNFYAGYRKRAVAQLAISVLTLGYGIPMSWLWAIVEVCTVERDSNGVQFRS